MAVIIHYNGRYNLHSTVVDAPLFESSLSREQLEAVIKEESGAQGLRELPDRLARAHEQGSSSRFESLDDLIASNRAGEKESNLSRDDFIRKYLS